MKNKAMSVVIYKDIETGNVRTIKGRILNKATDDAQFLAVVDDHHKTCSENSNQSCGGRG